MLDAIRGGAALYVAGFHSIQFLTTAGSDYHYAGGPFGLLLSRPYLGWLAFGHYAVLVFFVLSGYVVHLRQAGQPRRRYETGLARWSGHYLWRRGTRIYPPLIFALLLTLIVDAIGRAFFLPYYQANIAPDKLSSALMLIFPIHFRHFGSDSPLWSIQYELLFYLAYLGLLLVLVDRLRLSPIKITLAFASAGFFGDALLNLTHSAQPFLIRVCEYLPIWLAGMVLAELSAKNVALKRPAMLALAGTADILLLTRVSDNTSRVWTDYGWTIGIVLIMAAMLLREPAPARSNRVVRLLAGSAVWSYSLYLVHFPLLILAQAAWTSRYPLPSTPILAIPAFCFVVIVGVAVGHLIERPSRWLVAHPPRVLIRRPAPLPLPAASE